MSPISGGFVWKEDEEEEKHSYYEKKESRARIDGWTQSCGESVCAHVVKPEP